MTVFSARCNIYILRLCYDVSVRLSVTEVHWRIRFQILIPIYRALRSRCMRARGKGSSPGRVEGSSRTILATARPFCMYFRMHCITQYMYSQCQVARHAYVCQYDCLRFLVSRAVDWQLESSMRSISPPPTSGAAAAAVTEPVSVAADAMQVWSSPRRKSRSTPRQLSERHRQRRQSLKASPEGSTDEGPAEVVRTPRGRRREPRSKIPVLEKSRTFSTVVETAPSTTVNVALAAVESRTSDESTLVHPLLLSPPHIFAVWELGSSKKHELQQTIFRQP